MKISKNINKLMINFLLGFVLPLIITILLLYPLIVSKGIIAYGDENYFGVNKESYYFRIYNQFYIWSSGKGPSGIWGFVPYTFLYLGHIFDPEIIVKIFIIIVASLPGMAMYLSANIIFNEFKFYNINAVIFSTFASLFYLLVFVNHGLIYGASAPSWIYINTPLALALMVRYLNRGDIKSLLFLGIVSIIGNAQPIFLYVVIIIFAITLFYKITGIFNEGEYRNVNPYVIIKRSFLIFLVIVLLNSYALIPTLMGYVKGASGIYETYVTQNLINMDSLKFHSKWDLLNVLIVGEDTYFYFWLHPQNYTILNFLIPILAVLSLFISRRSRKYTTYFLVLLIIGIFLTKGVNPPGGYIYYIIAKELPYGAGAILRNPPKFVALVIVSYAFLLGLFISGLYTKLKRRWKTVLTMLLFLLLLVSVSYGTLLDLRSFTWQAYKPVNVPKIYNDINEWLLLTKQKGIKVIWIPSGDAYIWKPYIITAFPDLLSSKPAVDFKKIYPSPLEDTDEIGELLRVLGVKYVIYHGDSISYPNDKILDYLVRQRDLEVVYKANYTFRPEDNSRAPIPRGVEGFSFSNSPFELISPSYLPRGEEVTLVLKYRIPDEVVAKGFKGEFSIGFNIALEAYEAGYTTPDKSVAWSAAYKQEMVNETSGYAYFKIKIPYNYPRTAVDLYAWFYDGSFMMLTPRYFLGRLLVEPSTIEVPFIVFENKDYSGPVYVTRLAVAYGLDTIDVLSSKFISTRDYSMLLINPNAEVDGKLKRVLEHADLIVYPCSNATPPWMEEVMSSRNVSVACILPLGHLKLPLEKPVEGPKDTEYYVYNESFVELVGNPVLDRGGSSVVTVRYSLPPEVVEKGFKGKFGVGFNIMLIAFPHNIAPPIDEMNNYRVFEIPAFNQSLINDYEGFASFNISVPANAPSALDLYAWFYDGGFKRISQIYYIGTVKVRGASLVNNGSGYISVHLINSTLVLKAYVPKDDTYLLYLRAKGDLKVNSIQPTCGITSNACYVKLQLRRGYNDVMISTPNEAYIYAIGLVSAPNNTQQNTEDVGAVVEYREVSPVKWEVTVNTSKPFVLVFTEPYDIMWRAYINGKEIEPIPIYNLVNGFMINETGLLRIDIYYTLQTYYVLGTIITGVTMIGLILLTLRKRITLY